MSQLELTVQQLAALSSSGMPPLQRIDSGALHQTTWLYRGWGLVRQNGYCALQCCKERTEQRKNDQNGSYLFFQCLRQQDMPEWTPSHLTYRSSPPPARWQTTPSEATILVRGELKQEEQNKITYFHTAFTWSSTVSCEVLECYTALYCNIRMVILPLQDSSHSCNCVIFLSFRLK